jgi:hypothetical protein
MMDFDAINAAALRDARSLLPELLRGGRFEGDQYVVRNPRRDDKTPGSFKINSRTGVWKDFATGDGGGDLISLVAGLLQRPGYDWHANQRKSSCFAPIVVATPNGASSRASTRARKLTPGQQRFLDIVRIAIGEAPADLTSVASVCRRSPDGDLQATERGFASTVRHLPQIKMLIDAALDRARAAGLLDDVVGA